MCPLSSYIKLYIVTIVGYKISKDFYNKFRMRKKVSFNKLFRRMFCETQKSLLINENHRLTLLMFVYMIDINIKNSGEFLL